MKRLFDMCVACVALVLLMPFLALVAGLVWMGSGRPVLFSQWRVGRFGRLFMVRKFRTMVVDHAAEAGAFHAGNATRVTPIGRLLRKTKLDELPQLFNVLVGDMSLVGPRPEVRKWVEVFPDRWARVLTVRPGITDPASIVFRHEEELLSASTEPERFYRETVLPRKLDLYERYVATNTFFGDIVILFKTACAIFAKPPKLD